MNPKRRAVLSMIGFLLFVALGCNQVGSAVDNAVATLSAPAQSATPEAEATALPAFAEGSDSVPVVVAEQATIGADSSDAALVQLIDAAGLDFAERRNIGVYERVAPSVVNITTQVLVRSYFGVVPEDGSGSGFVLDGDGHILTNYHVIENAQQINVSFGDETQLPATVVGTDERNDLAVLQVDARAATLYPVQLGSSADLQVGQWAIAIGNPFGQFDRTLTTGVISALNRTLEGSDGDIITGVIQTDAAINRGNSGGPLLDSSGRVIGVNSAIFSPTGSNAGVGFAVPVDTLKRVLPDLLSLGYYRHPWLGIQSGYTLAQNVSDVLGLPVSEGILLVQLQDNSPLMLAGVRGAQSQVIIGNQRAYVGGDIITAVNGVPMASTGELDAWLEDTYQIGDTVTVSLLRDGAPFEVSVVLGEQPR